MSYLKFESDGNGTTSITGFKSNPTVVISVDDDDVEKILAVNKSWYYHAQRGYVLTIKAGRTIMLHRVIMGVETLGKEVLVDHISGVVTDCRKSNLRLTTSSGNLGNIHVDRLVGVQKFADGRWHATIGHDNKTKSLGAYANADDAARAYNIASKTLRGDICTLNDVEDPFKVPVRLQSQRGRKNGEMNPNPKYYVYMGGQLASGADYWKASRYFQRKYKSIGTFSSKELADDAVAQMQLAD